jgi:hypothetical protein
VVNLRDLDLWLKSPEQLAEVGETLHFLLEKTGALNFRVVEPYVRYRQEFYAHRALGVDEALTILVELARSLELPLTLEASPEVLKAGLPQADLFHLAALGPALAADELTAAAIHLLAQGATGDMGLLAPRDEPPPEAPGLAVDLGWFRPLNLKPAADAALARRALALALNYEGDRLAFSGAGASLAPVKDYPRLFAWLADRTSRRQDWGGDLGAGYGPPAPCRPGCWGCRTGAICVPAPGPMWPFMTRRPRGLWSHGAAAPCWRPGNWWWTITSW